MILKEDAADEARRMAKTYFQRDTLNCAESVLKTILELCGRPCPVETLALASGFGRGMGGAGCACGALVGGVMAIGALFGRTRETGGVDDVCGDLTKQLHDAFKRENGATCCRVLHRGLPFGTDEQLAACADRTARAAALAAEVVREGLEKRAPTSGLDAPAPDA